MKMLRAIGILIILGISFFLLAYHFLIPNIAADSISGKDIPSYIPERFKPAISEVRTSIDSGLSELPHAMARHGLTFEDVMRIVQSTDAHEVVPLINDFKQNPGMNADEAFDRVKLRLGDKVQNPEVFRPAFRERYSPRLVNRGLNFLSDSGMPIQMNIELARKTLIEVLKERRQEIENQLELIQGN